jgi:hypothetical protein
LIIIIFPQKWPSKMAKSPWMSLVTSCHIPHFQIRHRGVTTCRTGPRGPPSEIEPHHPQVPQSKLGQLLRAALHVLKDRAAESTLDHLPHGSADRGSSDVIGIEVLNRETTIPDEYCFRNEN